MEQTKQMFDINIDNIEDVYNTVRANKFTDEVVFIKNSDDLKIAMEDDNQSFIFLTDSVTLTTGYLNTKQGAAVYKSLINDKKIKNLSIRLSGQKEQKNAFELVSAILTTHPNLRRLEVEMPYNESPKRNMLSNDQWALLCQGLKHNKTLRELIIDEIDSTMGQMLADAINEHKTLHSIEICGPSELRRLLLASLKKNSTVQILQIEDNGSILDVHNIKELCQENTTIHTLIIRHFVYTDEDVDPLITLLQTSTSLHTLEFPLLEYNPGEGQGDKYDTVIRENILPRFIDALNRPQSPLRKLKIDRLYAECLDMLLKSLMSNSTLTSLQLSNEDRFYNHIEINQNTIEIWNELLSKNNTLKEISLNGPFALKEDFSNFSVDWFKHNTTLTKLDLRDNDIVDVLIGDALTRNTTLKALKISRRCITDRMWQALLTSSTLTEIYISSSGNNAQNDTCALLQHNTTVRKLTSTVFYQEWEQMLTILSHNNTITSYTNTRDVGGSPTDFSVQTILSLKNNWTLTHLDLKARWYEAFCEPILERNRQFKLTSALIMHNIARQKPTMFPMEIWRLIFQNLTPDVSILI